MHIDQNEKHCAYCLSDRDAVVFCIGNDTVCKKCLDQVKSLDPYVCVKLPESILYKLQVSDFYSED